MYRLPMLVRCGVENRLYRAIEVSVGHECASWGVLFRERQS